MPEGSDLSIKAVRISARSDAAPMLIAIIRGIDIWSAFGFPERMLFDRGLVRNLPIRSIREAGTLEAVTAPGVK